MNDSIDRLYLAIVAAKTADPAASRTSRLLRSGRSKMAKKLAEEAIEVVIDVIDGNTDAAVKESADLVYNLVALWVAAGIEPRQVWAEMARRGRLVGDRPKAPQEPGGKRTADQSTPGKHPARPPGGAQERGP